MKNRMRDTCDYFKYKTYDPVNIVCKTVDNPLLFGFSLLYFNFDKVFDDKHLNILFYSTKSLNSKISPVQVHFVHCRFNIITIEQVLDALDNQCLLHLEFFHCELNGDVLTYIVDYITRCKFRATIYVFDTVQFANEMVKSPGFGAYDRFNKLDRSRFSMKFQEDSIIIEPKLYNIIHGSRFNELLLRGKLGETNFQGRPSLTTAQRNSKENIQRYGIGNEIITDVFVYIKRYLFELREGVTLNQKLIIISRMIQEIKFYYQNSKINDTIQDIKGYIKSTIRDLTSLDMDDKDIIYIFY